MIYSIKTPPISYSGNASDSSDVTQHTQSNSGSLQFWFPEYFGGLLLEEYDIFEVLY
jgi:hypothetical protein